MQTSGTALVAGANGIIGKALMEELGCAPGMACPRPRRAGRTVRRCDRGRT